MFLFAKEFEDKLETRDNINCKNELGQIQFPKLKYYENRKVMKTNKHSIY